MRGRLSGSVLASAHSESATQFSAKLWDALSQRGRQRKLHPRLLTQNGIPAFPNGAQKETASHFDVGLREKWTVTWLGLEFA